MTGLLVAPTAPFSTASLNSLSEQESFQNSTPKSQVCCILVLKGFFRSIRGSRFSMDSSSNSGNGLNMSTALLSVLQWVGLQWILFGLHHHPTFVFNFI